MCGVRNALARTGKAANGLTSNDEGAVSALSARSNGLDEVDGGPERGVYTQMRDVEQVRVVSDHALVV